MGSGMEGALAKGMQWHRSFERGNRKNGGGALFSEVQGSSTEGERRNKED